MNDNSNILAFDEKKFSHVSKALQKQLNNYLKQASSQDSSKLSLSKTQEMLAQSLGFRNLHSLQSFWLKPRDWVADPTTATERTGLAHLSANQWIGLITMLSHQEDSDSMWRQRAMSLLLVVINWVVYLRDHEAKTFNMLLVYENMKLDKLIALYKDNEAMPGNIRSYLYAYLTNLPAIYDWQPSESTYQQHGYLQACLMPALRHIDELMREDLVIVPSQLVKAWFTLKLPTSHEEPWILRMRNWPYLQQGWLEHACVMELTSIRCHEKNFADITMQDFLCYASTLVMKPHIELFGSFLREITANLEQARGYSTKLQEIINQQ